MNVRRTNLAALCLVVLAGCGTSSSPAPSPSSSPISPGASATATANIIGQPSSINPPAPRSGAAMAYDPASRQLILVGGGSGAFAAGGQQAIQGTWAWDGHRWTRLHPATEAPALYGAVLVHDPVTDHLLLLSGQGTRDAYGYPSQMGMWSWDGQTWARVGDNPLQQSSASGAADLATRQVLLGGAGDTGAGGTPPPPFYVGNMWLWDGTKWTVAPQQLGAAGSPSVQMSAAGMAFDPITRKVIQYGGYQQAAFADTFAWDGHHWSTILAGDEREILAQRAPPAGAALAATDETRHEIVLLAGGFEARTSTPIPTTWTWDGSHWHRHVVSEPPLVSGAALAYDPQVGGVVRFGGLSTTSDGGTIGGTSSNDMYLWSGDGWNRLPSR